MKKVQGRQSNFELLRIIAMCMIIGLHYYGFYDASSTIPYPSNNYTIFQLNESFCICGVNLFILISGYFSCKKQNFIDIRKICNLLIDVIFWGSLGFLIACFFSQREFDLKDLIKTTIPYFWGGRWFVKAYIILLFFIPFLNICINSISNKSHAILIIIFTIIFSIWPSFLPSPPIDNYGYDFIHFIYLYLIASYIRLYSPRQRPLYIFLGAYIIFSCIVFTCSYFRLTGTSWAYNNIFVVLQAISLFLFFLQLNFSSRIINIIASCTFGVFLIHTDLFFGKLIYDNLFNAPYYKNASANIFILNFLVCIPSFFIIAFILEYIKQFIFDYSINRYLKKIGIINKIQTIN